VISRELFEKHGVFDENLPVCEDYDMWLRITCFERTGLINKKLIIKHGGHESQLSGRYWGMDRFRIYSIIKLLKNNLKEINPAYYNEAREICIKKCNIMRNGALKRGKEEFAGNISNIIESLESENYMNINSGILLKQ
jgi:hypothetical protein